MKERFKNIVKIDANTPLVETMTIKENITMSHDHRDIDLDFYTEIL